ncbi:hypothetical protein Tfer_2324 [Thermincola ferriacetica]|uniref:Probable membrane transporter protein n=1 Tax=Thermincola ferriacetica TaxID=281456 RepID=A0A0L6W122_9FIRM|nr:sulfite exporter TauE/SafE family protein [Thermincola ferriacetica]KNZ69078.1 hypothetical protein Tfer_2324 [Thermincola ferriacetica]
MQELFLLFIVGILSGIFGALLGLGGGFILIPALTIVLGLPMHQAIGISLISVIATSTGAASLYVREGKADIRLGMVLELSTTIGAIAGALIANMVDGSTLQILFGLLLLYNAVSMVRHRETAAASVNSAGRYSRLPAGLAASGLAGVLSGLLGIGGGLIKIPAMYILMGVPLKRAVATSNFMIGVTASASGFIFFFRGLIDPVTAAPSALGVFLGARLGTRFNDKISVAGLKKVFVVIFLYLAADMILKGLGVKLW